MGLLNRLLNAVREPTEAKPERLCRPCAGKALQFDTEKYFAVVPVGVRVYYAFTSDGTCERCGAPAPAKDSVAVERRAA